MSRHLIETKSGCRSKDVLIKDKYIRVTKPNKCAMCYMKA